MRDGGAPALGTLVRDLAAATMLAALHDAGCVPRAHAGTQLRSGRPVMCFDTDSRPPLPPIRGSALDARDLTLTSRDGTQFAAYAATPETPVRRRHRHHSGRPRAAPLLRGADAAVRRGGRQRRWRVDLVRAHRRQREAWRGLRVRAARAPARTRRRSTTTSPPRRRSCATASSGSTRSASASAVGSASSRRRPDSGCRASSASIRGRSVPHRSGLPAPADEAPRFGCPVLDHLRRCRCGHPGRTAGRVRSCTGGRRRRAPHGGLRGRPALVLRPQGRRLRRCQRRRVAQMLGFMAIPV